MVNRWFHRAAPLGFAALFHLGCLSPSDPGALVPPTADHDSRLPQRSITVAGRARAIHIETFGDPSRPVLFILHGSLADYRALRPFQVLSDRYFVVMWDQRGNGLSERIDKEEYTVDSIVEEIDALKELYAPDQSITLMGHSFGGMYSALYMSRHPSWVRQAVLLEPGGLNGHIFGDTFSDIVQINLFEDGMNQMFWQNEVLSPEDHEELDYRALMFLLNGDQMNYYCDREHPPRLPVWRPGGYVEYLRQVMLGGGVLSANFDYDFAVGLDAFPAKVLLIGGECSALGPDYQTRHHLPLFREAEVVSIPSAGHRLFVEQFDAVLAAVRGYLDEY